MDAPRQRRTGSAPASPTRGTVALRLRGPDLAGCELYGVYQTWVWPDGWWDVTARSTVRVARIMWVTRDRRHIREPRRFLALAYATPDAPARWSRGHSQEGTDELESSSLGQNRERRQ